MLIGTSVQTKGGAAIGDEPVKFLLKKASLSYSSFMNILNKEFKGTLFIIYVKHVYGHKNMGVKC